MTAAQEFARRAARASIRCPRTEATLPTTTPQRCPGPAMSLLACFWDLPSNVSSLNLGNLRTCIFQVLHLAARRQHWPPILYNNDLGL